MRIINKTDKTKMNKLFYNILLAGTILVVFASCSTLNKPEINSFRDMDMGWKFLCDSVLGAEAVSFNDAAWRTVDLPHDWSIEDLPVKAGDTVQGPFSKKSEGKVNTGNVVGGTGWYRKSFSLENGDANKRIVLHFDGVYMVSEVWVNGKQAGKHFYGYTPFFYDITPYLNTSGSANVIAVKVKNDGQNSRWYSGSGIYRHVWLTVTNPTCFETWGVTITTPRVSAEKAMVIINLKIRNKIEPNKQLTLITTILDKDGKEVNRTETKENASNGTIINST